MVPLKSGALTNPPALRTLSRLPSSHPSELRDTPINCPIPVLTHGSLRVSVLPSHMGLPLSHTPGSGQRVCGCACQCVSTPLFREGAPWASLGPRSDLVINVMTANIACVCPQSRWPLCMSSPAKQVCGPLLLGGRPRRAVRSRNCTPNPVAGSLF